MSKEKKNLPAIPNNPSEIVNFLELQLKELTSVETIPFKTSGNFPSSSGFVHIKEEIDKKILYGCGAQLIMAREAWDRSLTEVFNKTEFPSFSLSGFTYEDWEHDLNLRLTILEMHDRKTEIERDLKDTKEHISKEEAKKRQVSSMLAKYFS